MTSFIESDPVTATNGIVKVHKHSNSNNNYRRNSKLSLGHVLKPKEKYYKVKCNKLLKKKLKKYKLRQDGTEDQDVLDVSKILVSSLIIKSPQHFKDNLFENGNFNYSGDLTPKNYLFKMVRQKESIKKGNRVTSPRTNVKHDEASDLANPVTTEKKHTNAFQLLMDSRNKIIGGNSPGKDKNDNQSDNEDILEKKNIKIKRNLLLQKMADEKGYQKNKEREEHQDKIIKKKMDKRAKRFKIMLKETKPLLNENFHNKKDAIIPNFNNKDDAETLDTTQLNKKTKAFTIVDIFNTLKDPVHVSPDKKIVTQEDEEFLKKLSPSIRKKESMLSYFKKVDKESEISAVDSENDNLMKVKLQVKAKKKGRKKKLSLTKKAIGKDDISSVNNENDETASMTKTPLSEVHSVCVEHLESKNTDKIQMRIRNSKTIYEPDISESIVLNNDGRPKRSIKRPVKYTDDACLSSSDEDLYIFTPKKKKCLKSNNNKVIVNTKTEHIAHDDVNPVIEKKVSEEIITAKKSVKLAPIFATKQLDFAALEAKQKFLQSGVPDKLKKIIQQQKNDDMVNSDFPVVVHVQQLTSDTGKLIPTLPSKFHESVDDICSLNLSNIEKDAYKRLLNLNELSHAYNIDDTLRKSTQTVLQTLKQIYPKFPVYRTYRYFRGKRKGVNCNIDLNKSVEVINDEVDVSKESPDKLNWTDKYKAMSTDQIIGNFESIRELKKWLISWCENEIKMKSRGNTGSDSSDYYQSDTDSRDSFKAMNNLLILTGPTGCGKTSSIYAVAAELAIKVIEVNASSKRTGKIMLQELHEATQSHKVNRGTSVTDNSQHSQENSQKEQLRKNKKKGRPKKSIEQLKKKSSEKTEILSSTPSSHDSTRTAMSLILVDDADIVFEQDDGFTSAIVQLVQCSKRPVILITSSLVCPHLQRFLLNGKILKMCPLLPRMLGTWLDIMCLADSGLSWPGLGAKFLNFFKGDIRKTVNYLQFYISSYAQSINAAEELVSQSSESQKSNIDDENSNISWADHEDSDGKILTQVANNNIDIGSNSIWTNFTDRNLNLLLNRCPIQLFNIWWSVPHLLSSVSIVPNIKGLNDKLENPVVKEIESIADVIDAISLSDSISHIHQDSRSDITAWPWYTSENDSVSEQDNIDDYMKKYEVGEEICHTLVTGCITTAQDVLNYGRRTEIQFPGMSLQRERDKVVTRHKSLTSYLSPSATLDRRSLALDYWSACRTICRIEKSKSDAQVNVKRNNRFCHYLKSLSVLCKSDVFDNLCDSLSDQGTELNMSNFNE